MSIFNEILQTAEVQRQIQEQNFQAMRQAWRDEIYELAKTADKHIKGKVSRAYQQHNQTAECKKHHSMIAEMVERGSTFKAVADTIKRQTGVYVSTATISTYCKTNGIHPVEFTRAEESLTPPLKAIRNDALCGMTRAEMMHKYGCSRNVLGAFLKKHGISTMKKKRKLNINLRKSHG